MDTVRQRHEEPQVMVRSSLKGAGEFGLLNGGPSPLLLARCSCVKAGAVSF